MNDWGLFLLLTFIGGALGGFCRYGISDYIVARFGEFPAGTLVVNVSGAFLIGLVWALPWEHADAAVVEMVHAFLIPGFLGGYTTISSFTLDTLNLILDAEWFQGALNLFGSYCLCLAAVFGGTAVVGLLG